MTIATKAGIASAALAIAALSTPALSADLGHGRSSHGGSIKDKYVAPMPEVVRGPAGPCYFRADVGYSWSQDPSVKWPVNNITRTFANQADHDAFYNNNDRSVLVSETTTFIGDQVTGTSLENTAFGQAGFGCGSGSRGVRGEVMFGVYGKRKLDGEPQNFEVTDIIGVDPPEDHPVQVDPLHTSIRSYTMMFNAYKDLGNYGGVTPYVGAGVGLAYHIVDDVFFTGNPNLTNRIKGDSDISFAWSLMAGIGYQVSDRAIIDLGYRYIDMGKATSERTDNAGFVNPRVKIDDLDAHEIKIGLRYHFGSDCCAQQPVYQPLK
jgi:opacity protein-like surface antigen